MTETTQPDPQVVRCPWCEGHPQPCADHRAARTPLTVADIPAGQGPASLFLRPNIYGGFTVWFKTATGLPVSIHERRDYGSDLPNLAAGEAALWGHLAATLPTTTGDAP